MKWLFWFFSLFVVSVLVSQSAMDFFSILFCLQWCFLVFKSKRRPQAQAQSLHFLRPMGLEWIFLAWVVVAVIGFLLNPMDTQYAAKRIFEFKWILIVYVMIEVLDQLKPDRRNLPFLLSLILGISALNAFFYWADLPLFDEWRYGSGPGGFVRAGGLFVDPMTFAHSFAMFFCFLLGLCLVDAKNWSAKQRGWAFFALLLSALGLYWTFTRGVWVGLILGVGLPLFFWRPKWAVLSATALGLLIGALHLWSGDFRTRVTESRKEYQGVSQRKYLWQANTEIFKEHPFFGKGYGQNTQILPEIYEKLGIPKEGSIVSHAHNQYLHLAAGTGIFGLLLYLVIWFFFFRWLFQLWKSEALSNWDRGMVLGMSMALVTFCIGSLTEANFERSKVRFAVMLIWAVTIHLARKYNLLSLRSGKEAVKGALR